MARKPRITDCPKLSLREAMCVRNKIDVHKERDCKRQHVQASRGEKPHFDQIFTRHVEQCREEVRESKFRVAASSPDPCHSSNTFSDKQADVMNYLI